MAPIGALRGFDVDLARGDDFAMLASDGATPGLPGATVLVAHVWWNGAPGSFRRLGALEPDARIEVASGDTDYSYQVVKRTRYDKDSLPGDLWRNSGPETLVLTTCGGTFDKATRRYGQNIVVYAEPAAGIDGPTRERGSSIG